MKWFNSYKDLEKINLRKKYFEFFFFSRHARNIEHGSLLKIQTVVLFKRPNKEITGMWNCYFRYPFMYSLLQILWTYLQDIRVNVSSPEAWSIVIPVVASFLFLSLLLAACWWCYHQKQKRQINALSTDLDKKANARKQDVTLPDKRMKRNSVHPLVEEKMNVARNSLHPLHVISTKGRPLPLARVSPIFMSHPETTDTLKPIKSHNDIFNIYKSSVNDPHIHRTGRRVSNDV